MTGGRRRSMRTEIVRTARAAPHLTAELIAARVGCHPATVRNHLPTPPRRTAGLVRFVTDPDPHVRATAAARPLCPPKMLARLASDAEQPVRAAVVEHSNCPPRILVRLATDASYTVRTAAAGHSNCPPQTLTHLAGDPIWDVVVTVARNRNCPPQALRRLSGYTDDDGTVRCEAARNRNCPPAALRQLLDDEDASVRRVAADRLRSSLGGSRPGS